MLVDWGKGSEQGFALPPMLPEIGGRVMVGCLTGFIREMGGTKQAQGEHS